MQQNSSQPVYGEAAKTDPHQWVFRYADYLYTYALRRINDQEQARDLVQETFLSALETLHKFEGRSSEKTWLTAILKNKVIDIYRQQSSQSFQKIDIARAEERQRDFFDPNARNWNVEYRPRALFIDEEDQMVRKELTEILQRCIQKLPSLWISVFTMRHMDDQGMEFICSELNVTDSNFWVIIHRAKLSLRACLQKNWI